MSTEGMYLNIIKAIYDKPTANIILNSEKLKTFPLTSRTRQECSHLPLSFNTILEVLARIIKQENKKKTQIEKEEVKLSLLANHISYIEKPKDTTKIH